MCAIVSVIVVGVADLLVLVVGRPVLNALRRVARRAGEDTLASALSGVTTDRTTWVTPGHISGDAVTMVRELGARRLVVPAAALNPAPDAAATPTTAIQLAADGAALPVEAAVADAGFADAFGSSADPVLRAYQFVAELLAGAINDVTTRPTVTAAKQTR
jgi:hypothetical protein